MNGLARIRRFWWTRIWPLVGGVSIRTKILGIVLLMIFLPGLVLTVQIRLILVQVLRGQLRQQGVAIARDLAARGTDLVLIRDLYALNRLLRDTRTHNPEVRYAFFLSPDGEILAHTFEGGFPLGLLSVNPLSPGEEVRIQPLQTEEGRIWDVAVPVFEGRAGTVRIGLREHHLWQVVNTVTGQMLLTLLLVSLVGVAAAFTLTWVLTRPILELVEATRRVSQGDYSPRVRRWANDEVGDLSEAFNDMVLQLQRAEAERAEREKLRQFYLRRIIQAQEEERKRIARELHDEMGQALASMMVGLRNLEEVSTLEERDRRLDELRRIVRDTLERVRRLAFDLRPSVLDDLGLVAALRRYAKSYQERFGIEVELQAVGLEDLRLPPEVETTVYRIVQEAMTNAAKYARCAHLSILLQVRDRRLSVIVEDDGCGFDVPRVFEREVGRTRLGLYGMRERAELIGGDLKIESQPGAGTAIYLRVPLETVEKGRDHASTGATPDSRLLGR